MGSRGAPLAGVWGQGLQGFDFALMPKWADPPLGRNGTFLFGLQSWDYAIIVKTVGNDVFHANEI
jgi:hypothetical protein